MSKTRFFLVMVLGVTLLSVALYLAWRIPEKKEVLMIGLGGPMSGTYNKIGHSMRRGVELAIKDINKSDALKKYEFRLAVVDDHSATNANVGAENAARKLVAIPNLTAVIGHYFSGASREAGDVYRTHSIPFVTPSATLPSLTANNEWAFGIMPDDYYQSTFLANYVLHGLNRKTISIIHSKDSYGTSLTDFFVKELKINNVTPVANVEIDQKDLKPETLKTWMDDFSKSDIIFLAMNYVHAAKIIQYMRKNGINTDFIGPESLGGTHFIQEAGIYAEGVYAVTPYLPSLFGEESKHYQSNFIKEFQMEPDWVSTYSYEAVQLIAYAIGNVGRDTTKIRGFMRKMISLQEAMPSIAGALYFNQTGSSRRDLSVGQVKQGRYGPARFQLTHVKYQELAKAKIEKEKEKTEIFTMDGLYMKRATVVYTGIYVSEIKSFDPVEGSFIADFNLWFRWDPGKNSALDFEMTYGKVLTANIMEKYFDEGTNNNFISYAVSAKMTDQFPLQEYPFDVQILKIRIKPKMKTNEDLILVTDIDDDTVLKKSLAFGPWKDVDHFQFTSSKDFLWSYRNPKYDLKLFSLEHSQYSYHVILKRDSTAYIITFLPLMVLVGTAYLIFTLDFDVFSSRYSMGTMSILSAMSYHNVNKLGVGYLVRGDLFFLSAYFLFFCTILETSVASYLKKIKEEELAYRLDIVSMILYPIGVGISLWIILK
ncbi:MAG: ABC transporter substrate-binding protein [Magnetococcales bacterium]|nr:ABC transporter substrate-binding protein [Magnetococcales bacterium]